ncbi:TonB-dependent receptor [Arcticibacter svalbardensis MN12-7]|uniref:TonB-dependent receptor n=1 Tax=Arcticibacter svalbardensis MN12-7 TaxID=1150600 RepID=R9GRU2_9SPHI|nr:energy transducer TonB [Arcticibacter svalbardensis]EOR94418.1 TonB-dependent receptor [Arcticibacter svalbardensis MN12-7]
MGETNKLKYNLLQQYLNGQLDPKGMHELEKDALEDPFLAEALDGYEHIKGSVHPHLSILQRQLEDRIAQKYVKKNAMFFTWQRLSVAAAASLLFVSASILFFMKGANRSAKVAVNPKQTEVKLTAADRLGKEESDPNRKDEEQLVAATVPNKAVDAGSLPSTNSQVRTAVPSISSPESLSGSSTRSKVQAADVSASKTKEAYANVPLNENTKAELTTSANGRTSSSAITAKSDLLIASAPNARLSRTASAQPMSAEPSNSLNEVVVLGYGSINKQGLAEPAEGWKTYREYLVKNQNSSLKTLTKDSVIVLFNVDVNGNPINLTIEKGIDELHNKEAIRLIKQGSRWKTNIGEGLLKGRVTVPF